MIKDLQLGVTEFLRSALFVAKHNLWVYFLAPLLFTLAITYFKYIADSTLEAGEGAVRDTWLIGSSLSWIIGAIESVLDFILLEMNKFLVLTVLSPVIALLSERTEKIITGNEYPFNFNQLMKDVARGILMALRNITLEMLCWLGWLIIASIIPTISNYNSCGTLPDYGIFLWVCVYGLYQ